MPKSEKCDNLTNFQTLWTCVQKPNSVNCPLQSSIPKKCALRSSVHTYPLNLSKTEQHSTLAFFSSAASTPSSFLKKHHLDLRNRLKISSFWNLRVQTSYIKEEVVFVVLASTTWIFGTSFDFWGHHNNVSKTRQIYFPNHRNLTIFKRELKLLAVLRLCILLLLLLFSIFALFCDFQKS